MTSFATRIASGEALGRLDPNVWAKPFLEGGEKILSATLLVVAWLFNVSMSLFLLWLVHQLTLWLSQDPIQAFHGAKVAVDVFGQVYDVFGVFYNAMLEFVLLVLPAWNSASQHVLQPLVFAGLEIFALVFTQQPYDGIITETDLPFEGHRCPEDGTTGTQAVWCGVASAWQARLGFSKEEDGFVANGSIVLGTETARRLSEESNGFVGLTLPLDGLLDALSSLVAAAIVIVAQMADLFWHVFYQLMSALFKILFDTFLMVVRNIGSTIMMIINSGAFTDILRWGIDLLVIIGTRVVIPFFMRAVDMLFCVMDLFAPDGWGAQLTCIKKNCYLPGSDLMLDPFFLFSSIPDGWDVFQLMQQDLINKITGQSFGGRSSGPVDTPFSFSTFTFASLQSPQSKICEACFVCKVPEFRMLWLAIGYLGGCIIDATRFEGAVSDHCLVNGSYYSDTLCGPIGLPLTDFDVWYSRGYTGYRTFDNPHLQSLAVQFKQLSEDRAGSIVGLDAGRVATAWFNRFELAEPEAFALPDDDVAAPFVFEVCRTLRSANDEDPGDEFAYIHNYGSLGYWSSRTAYEMCKRTEALPTCKVDGLASLTDTIYEVANCAKNQPECLRDRSVCLGTCSGNEDESLLRQDVATHLSKQEFGSSDLTRARINATLLNIEIPVPLFDTGAAMLKYISRLRVRGGFTGELPQIAQFYTARTLH